jgi:glycerol-3-phosphate dehydrogenase
VFVLPLGEQVLVGTTDVPFEGDPREARATEEELQYLLSAVNQVFPDLRLTRADVDWHYAGVRPLPYADRRVPASITRRHWLHEHTDAPLPMYSVIGGKLTTCRSLAETAADTLLHRLGWPVKTVSRSRPLPGGDAYPGDAAAVVAEQQHVCRSLRRRSPPCGSFAATARAASLLSSQIARRIASMGRTCRWHSCGMSSTTNGSRR